MRRALVQQMATLPSRCRRPAAAGSAWTACVSPFAPDTLRSLSFLAARARYIETRQKTRQYYARKAVHRQEEERKLALREHPLVPTEMEWDEVGEKWWADKQKRKDDYINERKRLRHRSKAEKLAELKYGAQPSPAALRKRGRGGGGGGDAWRRQEILTVPTPQQLPYLLKKKGMARWCGLPENSGKVLMGLDVGETKFGVALTDSTRTEVIPLDLILRRDRKHKTVPKEAVSRKLMDAIEDNHVCGLVVGWPVEKNGDPGTQCIKVLNFLAEMQTVEKLPVPVLLMNETDSTILANEKIAELKLTRWQDEMEDKVAAAIILEYFLFSEDAMLYGVSERA